MFGFKENSIKIRQIAPGIYDTLEDLTYIGQKGQKITIRSGYITDGYSKPLWSKSLVGGSFGDDIRPAILHDYLCQYKSYYDYDLQEEVPVTFKEANDLFLEAMKSVKVPFWKRILMRFAVDFNPNKW